MKSRMDKYYKDEDVMQRTSKNDALYEALYREKQMPRSNVTVIDNINEIDISKIKTMVNGRESYKRVRKYEKLVNPNDIYKTDSISYEFDEIDDNNYDINEILKNKRSSRVYNSDPSKVRRITSREYDIISSFENRNYENEVSNELIDSEKQIKELLNTISRTQVTEATDLFSNLKEDKKEAEKNKEDEEAFYTSTSKIESSDFDFGIEEKNNSTIFIIIGVVAVVVALAIVFYIKFLN